MSGDDGSSDEDIESDLEGLIDDGSDVEEDNASYYRTFDNSTMNDESSQQPGPSSTSQTMYPILTDEEYSVEQKRLKKVKSFLSKLKTYIGQITILGFNSQKYDIPLIRSYLPSSIIKYDGTPKQVIKKMSGYMVLSSEKLKFLDNKLQNNKQT